MQETTKSTIVYTLTMEDLLAHSLFEFRRLPAWQNGQRNIYMVFPIIFGALLLWYRVPDPSLIAAFAFSLWLALYSVYDRKRGYIKRVRKSLQATLAKHSYPGLLGEHKLEVDEDGITHTSTFSRTQYAWGALKQIESEPPYTFIDVGDLTFILRNESLISGDLRDFLEKIGRYHKSGQTIAQQRPLLES
jgi:hypothetical protein